MENIVKIKKADFKDDILLSEIISISYQTVADKFNLTKQNCPKHPSNCGEKWIQNDFQRGVEYFILYLNDSAIGCAALEKADNEICYLERLAVLPKYRHREFGKSLVDHIFKKAKNSDFKKISIGIISKDSTLKKWYQNFGFIEETTKEFPHLPFLVTFMTCGL